MRTRTDIAGAQAIQSPKSSAVDIASLVDRLKPLLSARSSKTSLDAQWASLSQLSSEYQNALKAVAEKRNSDAQVSLDTARTYLSSAYLSFWDRIWNEATVLYSVETLTTSVYWTDPAAGTAVLPSSLLHFRAVLLHSVVSAWYSSAIALNVPLPQDTHARVVRLAGLRSVASAKLACNAVSLFGVAPGPAALGAVIEACVRHACPSHSWPYLVGLATRGLQPQEEVLEALVGAAQRETEALPRAMLAHDGSGEDGGLALMPVRDAGTGAVVTHAMGLQAESLRGNIAEFRAAREVFGPLPREGDGEGPGGGDSMLATAISTVNAAYAMPVEAPVPGTPEAEALAATEVEGPPPTHELPRPIGSGELQAQLQQLEELRSRLGLEPLGDVEGDDGDEGRADDGDDDDDDGEVEEGGDADDEATYNRLSAEAAVVRAALFGAAPPATSASPTSESAPPSQPTAPSAGDVVTSQGLPAPHDPSAPPPTVLCPEWVTKALAAETARRELAGGHLLEHMHNAAVEADEDGSHPRVSLTPAQSAALRDRLEFAARHSVLHLMPDGPHVQAAVTRWQLALLALGRQAAATNATRSGSTVAPSAEGSLSTSASASGSVPRYVSIPYMTLMTDPAVDPRQPSSLFKADAVPQSTGAAGDEPVDETAAAARALFRRLHPLYASAPGSAPAGAPLDPASRAVVSRCLARVYRSIMSGSADEDALKPNASSFTPAPPETAASAPSVALA